mgnify:CR=1 FL=1
MPIVINGSGTITGLSVGGLPDGIVDTDMLAANAVATAKIADGAVTSTKSTGLGGLTMVDQWRWTSSGEFNGILTADWERNDNNFAQIGTGMTVTSGGIFSFPATGIYRIDFQGHSKRTDNITIPEINVQIQATTDNFSSSTALSMSSAHIGGANNSYAQQYHTAIFDVTNITTHKFRIYQDAAHPTNFVGSTTSNRTALTIMKLGET